MRCLAGAGVGSIPCIVAWVLVSKKMYQLPFGCTHRNGSATAAQAVHDILHPPQEPNNKIIEEVKLSKYPACLPKLLGVPVTEAHVTTGLATGQAAGPFIDGCTYSMGVRFSGELPLNSPMLHEPCMPTHGAG